MPNRKNFRHRFYIFKALSRMSDQNLIIEEDLLICFNHQAFARTVFLNQIMLLLFDMRIIFKFVYDETLLTQRE